MTADICRHCKKPLDDHWYAVDDVNNQTAHCKPPKEAKV